MTKPLHIAHIVYAFATGGLENGVVNIINRLPSASYRHSIICITGHDADFIKRISNDNVDIYDLNKSAGKGLGWLVQCWRLLRQLKPDICHSRNLNALEGQIAAALAGVPYRIHGEHGWDVSDLGGTNVKYQKLRRLLKVFVHHYVALSLEAVDYLKNKIKLPATKISHICNGVDVDKFNSQFVDIERPEAFSQQSITVFGTVGRLAEVKNQTFLVDAFIELIARQPEYKQQARLMLVGDGILLEPLKQRIAAANISELVWFTGRRDDVARLMNVMDVFVLPSLAEGISNTLLEAMASGLPYIATNVGGNSDLILPSHQESHIVAVNNIEQLVTAMVQYLQKPEQLAIDSKLVRQHCLENFSIEQMVAKYHHLYQQPSIKSFRVNNEISS